jgi:DNA invertase Pin-like site-specific DNA recombinase
VDQESGRTTDRTNLQEMLTYCGKNRGIIARVVVADLSRLARNVSDQGWIIARLSDMGIELVSVDEPHIDRSAAGKLSANMLGP